MIALSYIALVLASMMECLMKVGTILLWFWETMSRKTLSPYPCNVMHDVMTHVSLYIVE